MTADAKLILNRTIRTDRWQYQERGDYNLNRFDREFREGLYSDHGREVLRNQRQNAVAPNGQDGDGTDE